MNLYVIVEEKSLKKAHSAMKKFTCNKDTKRFDSDSELFVPKPGKKEYRYTRWPMSGNFQARIVKALEDANVKCWILRDLEGFNPEPKQEEKTASPKQDPKNVKKQKDKIDV